MYGNRTYGSIKLVLGYDWTGLELGIRQETQTRFIKGYPRSEFPNPLVIFVKLSGEVGGL